MPGPGNRATTNTRRRRRNQLLPARRRIHRSDHDSYNNDQAFQRKCQAAIWFVLVDGHIQHCCGHTDTDAIDVVGSRLGICVVSTGRLEKPGDRRTLDAIADCAAIDKKNASPSPRERARSLRLAQGGTNKSIFRVSPTLPSPDLNCAPEYGTSEARLGLRREINQPKRRNPAELSIHHSTSCGRK
jgi:hypothetical protein